MVTMGIRELLNVLARHTALKLWIATEIRWYRNVVSRGSAVQGVYTWVFCRFLQWGCEPRLTRDQECLPPSEKNIWLAESILYLVVLLLLLLLLLLSVYAVCATTKTWSFQMRTLLFYKALITRGTLGVQTSPMLKTFMHKEQWVWWGRNSIFVFLVVDQNGLFCCGLLSWVLCSL